jgi:hypothetical protein
MMTLYLHKGDKSQCDFHVGIYCEFGFAGIANNFIAISYLGMVITIKNGGYSCKKIKNKLEH